MPEPEEPEFDDEQEGSGMTGRQQYNLVTDTIVGPNIRLKDNVIQGVSVLVCLLIGGGIGWFFVENPMQGILGGGLVGMLVGVFGSGLYLMIYRAMKHLRKDHD
jgi:hypothetical protein